MKKVNKCNTIIDRLEVIHRPVFNKKTGRWIMFKRSIIALMGHPHKLLYPTNKRRLTSRPLPLIPKLKQIIDISEKTED
jgi:hypothetical protein